MSTTSSTSATPSCSRWWRALGWAAAIGVCALVFAMYTVPDFMVMVADKVWSCF